MGLEFSGQRRRSVFAASMLRACGLGAWSVRGRRWARIDRCLRRAGFGEAAGAACDGAAGGRAVVALG
eukprot:9275221-Alexandrium_andersonii.AAC.1